MSEGEGAAERQLGDFRILREIGRGGMGTVYLAEQISLRRTVALKVLNPGVSLNPNVVRRFQREAEAAGRLHHPYVIQVFAVGEEQGTHYFAMEYVDGESLDQIARRLRKGAKIKDLSTHPSTWSLFEEAREERPEAAPEEREEESGDSTASESREFVLGGARLMAEVADALDYAHRHGIIHRDVKPHNIIVDRSGRPFLVDFGLAMAEGTMGITKTGEVFGTPTYMSPEQLAGSLAKVDHRTDVYSLGCSFYELLTLRRPFDGKTPQEIVRKILTADPKDPRKLNPAIPKDLATILLKCMEKDPEKRYRTAAELEMDTKRFLAGEPILARPIGALEQTYRFMARRRGPTAAAAAIVVLVGAVSWLGTKTRSASRSMQAAEAARLAREAEEKLAEDVEEAERLMVTGLEKDHSNAALHLVRGRIYLARGNLFLAEQAFLQSAELDPRNPKPRIEAADVFQIQKKHEQAAQYYRQALELDPNLDQVHDKLGECLREMGERAASNQAFEKAEEIRSAQTRPLLEAGKRLLDQAEESRDSDPEGGLARLREAEAKFSDALRRHPELGEALLLRGVARLRREDLAGAKRDLEEATKKRGVDPSAFFHLGMVYVLAGNLDEAKRNFERTVAASEGRRAEWPFGSAHFRLAQIAAVRGGWSGALAHVDQTLRWNPQDAPARLLRAVALQEMGNSEEAEKQFEKAAAAGPPDGAEGILGGAILKERRGAWEAAWEQLAAAEKDYPDHPQILYHRARIGIGHKRGDPADRRALDRAISLEPENAAAYLVRFSSRLQEQGSGSDFFEALDLDPEFTAQHFFEVYRTDLSGFALLESLAPPLPRSQRPALPGLPLAEGLLASADFSTSSEEEDRRFLSPRWRDPGSPQPPGCSLAQIEGLIEELKSISLRVREIAEKEMLRCGWSSIAVLRSYIDHAPSDPEALALLERLEERRRGAEFRAALAWLRRAESAKGGRLQELGPETLPALIQVLREAPDRNVKRLAFQRIVGIGATEAEAGLLELLEDRDSMVRFYALRALGVLGRPPSPERLKLVFQESQNAAVRLAVLLAAGGGATAGSLRELLEMALSDPMPVIRWMAVRQVGERGERALMATLRKSFMSEEDPDVREQVYRALLQSGHEGAALWAGMIQMLGRSASGTPHPAEAFLKAFPRKGGGEAPAEAERDFAREVLAGRNPWVRIHLLRSWDPALLLDHLPVVFEMKESEDPLQRAAAVWALALVGVEAKESVEEIAARDTLEGRLARSLLAQAVPMELSEAKLHTALRRLEALGRAREAETLRRRMGAGGKANGGKG